MAIYYGNAAGKAAAEQGDFSAGMLIYEDGIGAPYSEDAATKLLSEPEVYIWVDLKMGDASATAWGCDLTYDYVKINADYRS